MERLIFVTKSPTAHGDKERVSQSCFLSSREKYWVSPAAAKGKMEACVTPPRTEPVSRNCVARLGGSSRISRNLGDEILLCSLQEGRSDAAPFHAVDNKLSPDEGSKGGRAELTSKVDNLSWTF